MTRRISIFSVLFAFLLVLTACTNTNSNGADEPAPSDPEVNEEVTGEDDIEDENEIESEDGVDEPNDTGTENGDEATEPQFVTAEDMSTQLIEAIANEDLDTVAQYVHQDEGLLFSPYVYIADDAVVINQEDVADLLTSTNVFTWGLYDGKGTPIQLTPAAYFEEFLDMSPFEEPDAVLVNDLQDRGNTINNIAEKFPTATVIEYYNAGSEEYAGIDWSSILFVYEKDANEDEKLIAIIRDMWTT